MVAGGATGFLHASLQQARISCRLRYRSRQLTPTSIKRAGLSQALYGDEVHARFFTLTLRRSGWRSKLVVSSLLKFAASTGQARRKTAKKRNVWGNHEHFEPLSNAASPSAAEFQQTARGDARFQGMVARRIRFLESGWLIVMRYSSGAPRSHKGRNFTKREFVA
jgi:hypothetical protein